jgi:hypothetical protein
MTLFGGRCRILEEPHRSSVVLSSPVGFCLVSTERERTMTKAALGITLVISFLAAPQTGQAQTPEIAAAVIPLPASLRGGAGVVRLDEAGQPEVLQKATNGIVCIADKPGDERFDVRCYQEYFIPVVYRAFQLGYQVSGEKVEAEIKAGRLHLSNQPAAGYRCLGPASGYDPSTNTINSQIRCWQSIHFPFRTAREIGFPDMSEVPADLRTTVPYVMSSGNYWAHVMIEHPAK